MDLFISIYALVATLPFISFFLIYYIAILFNRTKKEAFNLSIYITSVLLYSVVTAQIKLIFSLKNGFWWTLSWVLLIFVSLIFLQLKIKGKLNFKKLIMATSKLSFLSFGFMYLVFFILEFL